MLTIKNCRLHPDRSESADIHCREGSLTVVLGRNQSGKTALCRLIAGLPSTASGDITIDGETHGRKSGPVSMVFQAFVNYPNWNVAQNIASPMLAGGKADNERVRVLAELVKIDHLLERMPNEVSGGQQQRLAIARALAKDPAVLVMDEPFVNIDFKLREALNLELRTLVDETGVALVFTSSDPSDALSLADQLLLLEDHRILQQGPPLDLYREPVDFRAASLLSDPALNRISATRYVRPEHVTVGGEQGEFSAIVDALETNGAESYIHADVQTELGVEPWVVKAPGIAHVSSGASIRLAVDAQDILELAS